ncbi:HAD-IA family hydrolase [Billgrantia diversa]|uniref:HAD family hydrolase n=1 Tax=Halomonas sp. MCCC 1A13316 TaxID=2733487 RepID=UPI0018A37351|nr:HAD-IA family hydrolase [Halomonas sp. MCCC 1A13316]QOR37348.1 HAD-IA family hydrolase [Halomonas sp. MCCC 1A13316]
MSAPLCLLFDSDGALVDSEILLAEVMADVLPRYGLPFTAAQYMEEFRGVRFLTIMLELEDRHRRLDEAQRQAMETSMRELMEARMRKRLMPIAGMTEALLALHEHPRAVVSNGPERKIRCAMECVGFTDHFGDNLFSAYSLGVWKPDPALYLRAAEAMGHPPQRCVVIDDAAAGLAAGMQVIHLNRFPAEETTPAGALAVHHARDLPAAVQRLSQRAIGSSLTLQRSIK